jgi:hypothetical protein
MSVGTSACHRSSASEMPDAPQGDQIEERVGRAIQPAKARSGNMEAPREYSIEHVRQECDRETQAEGEVRGPAIGNEE